MNLHPFIVALADTRQFKRVGDALELAEVRTDSAIALPAAFVLPDSESAQSTQLGTHIFDQLVTSLVAVVVIVGADGARRGAAGAKLHDLEGHVLDALVARSFPGLDRPVEYADARIISLGAGRVSRLLRFRAVRRIRVVRNPS